MLGACVLGSVHYSSFICSVAYWGDDGVVYREKKMANAEDFVAKDLNWEKSELWIDATDLAYLSSKTFGYVGHFCEQRDEVTGWIGFLRYSFIILH